MQLWLSGSQGGEGGLYPWVSTKQAGFLGLILANTQFQNLSKQAFAHWDFLPKFLSLHYHTTLEGILGVQRSEQAQETIVCLFGLAFFHYLQNKAQFPLYWF